MNITRVEMCEGLMEEMVAEEQQAVEECTKAEKHSGGFGRNKQRQGSGLC